MICCVYNLCLCFNVKGNVDVCKWIGLWCGCVGINKINYCCWFLICCYIVVISCCIIGFVNCECFVNSWWGCFVVVNVCVDVDSFDNIICG